MLSGRAHALKREQKIKRKFNGKEAKVECR
jgi:hypothetical protein